MVALVLLAGCNIDERMQQREDERMQQDIAEPEAEALDEEVEVTQSPEEVLDVYHEAYFQMQWDEMSQHATPDVQADLEQAKQFFATSQDQIVDDSLTTAVDYKVNSVDHVNDNEMFFSVTHIMSDGSEHERDVVMEKTDAGWVVANSW